MTLPSGALLGRLRHEDIADLELSRGENTDLATYEEPGRQRDRRGSRDRPGAPFEVPANASWRLRNSERFKEFKKTVADAIKRRGWFLPAGLPTLPRAGGLPAAAGGIMLWVGAHRLQSFAPRWSDVLLIAFGICLLVSAAIVGVGLYKVRLWRRRIGRRPDRGRALAGLPPLPDPLPPARHRASPAALELWERLLVYGIAFGIAERVLEGAHLYMPEEIHQSSSIFWISPNGDLGSVDPSALGIGDLSAGFGSALAPPSSGSGGFGGGFSVAAGRRAGGGAWAACFKG